jgi:thiamine kinase-like enzyme
LDPLAKSVERLSARLGELEGSPTPLEGGITNRNYRARIGGVDVVIRLPGKDTALLEIDRQAERAASEGAARVGVGPEVVAMLDDPPCLVTRFIVGEQLSAADLRASDNLREVAAALRKVHGSGELPVGFSAFRIVEDYAAKATRRGTELPADYRWGLGLAARIEAAMGGDEHQPVPCHNDLLAANFLRGGDGIRIVDWEYAGMGDRYFDLGNFAVNNELDHDQEAELLSAYFDEPTVAVRLAPLRLMRFMSDFREAMWGVLQDSLSDLDFDFDGYARDHFDRMRETAADPAFEASLEEARGVAG